MAPKEGNSLAEARPEIARQWHPTKNGNLRPSDVHYKSFKKVWWQCDQEHEWETIVNNRSRGDICPHCWKIKRNAKPETRATATTKQISAGQKAAITRKLRKTGALGAHKPASAKNKQTEQKQSAHLQLYNYAKMFCAGRKVQVHTIVTMAGGEPTYEQALLRKLWPKAMIHAIDKDPQDVARALKAKVSVHCIDLLKDPMPLDVLMAPVVFFDLCGYPSSGAAVLKEFDHQRQNAPLKFSVDQFVAVCYLDSRGPSTTQNSREQIVLETTPQGFAHLTTMRYYNPPSPMAVVCFGTI